MEFMALVGLIMTVFLVYAPFFWQQQEEINLKSEYVIAEKISNSLKREVDTAVMFGNGYRRNFTMPSRIRNYDYTVSVDNPRKMIVINWDDKSIETFLIAHDITGTPTPGQTNTISNRDDTIVFS